mmetsp:Transcript_17256/g.30409  ORF Transcript_17256/g.30409 Transcript_17256/m.30409 type:complete len:196 (-) Transcript_17256:304-891(-)
MEGSWWSKAPLQDQYRPSCSARGADGFIRGGLVGMAWGAYFHPLDELASTGWVRPSVGQEKEVSSTPKLKPGAQQIKPQTAFLKKKVNTAPKRPGPTGVVGAAFPLGYLRATVPRLRSMGQASLMFGCFLGTFSGVTCAAEEVTKSNHWATVFTGGFAAGSLLAARSGSCSAMIVTATGTAVLTSLLHVFSRNDS